MDLCRFPRHGEFVYAFLNPHFTCLSLQVSYTRGIIIPPRLCSTQIVPSPLKMINLLLVFAVYLLADMFLFNKAEGTFRRYVLEGQQGQK